MTTLAGCQSGESGPPTGHIYVENGSGEERELLLVIAEKTGETLDYEIQGRYRIPEGHVLQFEGVLEPDVTHVVRAALPGTPPQDRVSATINQCTGDYSVERVVSIVTQVDGLGIITPECGGSYSERDLEYVAASEYQMEAIDRKLTPTPAE